MDIKKLAPDRARLLTAMMSGKKAQVWRLLVCDQMVGAGFRPGDYVIVDVGQSTVESGKIVLAEVNKVPVFRLYFPPHLYALTAGPQPAPLVVDQLTTIVQGVVLDKHTFP